MTYLEAFVLALVEGLTEFLPVSSTGHMIIASSMLGMETNPFTKTFMVAIQLGAILSVVVLYWKRFFQTVDFYFKLFVAFVPAMIAGLLLGDTINLLFESVEVVAIMLILGGVFFLFIDKIFKDNETAGQSEISFPIAFKIGLFQCVALIPGVSRSAATIVGGLTQKLSRKSAAEFSFFLAVPTMVAATTYKVFQFYKSGNGFETDQLAVLAFGNLVAFIVAILAIRSFIGFLTNHGFKVFGYYRIVLGVAILTLYWLGIDLDIV